MFAIIVGFVAVVIVGFFAYSWIAGQFSRRNSEITRLTEEIKKFDRTANLGRAAARKISQYEERSLPAKPEVARTGYQTWLVNEMEAAELIEPDMRLVTSVGGEKDLFVKQSFQIDANGTLPQVVELLHAFYSVDWLHRITRLTLRPVKDSKLLDITIHIETLSLRKASNTTDKLVPRPSNRLLLASRDAYYDAIVGRNVFGTRNNPPTISANGSQDVFLGRGTDLNFKWTDPDPFDQVYFNLVESANTDAKLDPITGTFTWTPKEPGNYEFVIEGTDDGFPAKVSNREKIVINVREQSKAPPPAIFDFAKFTVLTALLDVDGQGEIWLHVRPTGQMVTLHQGDQFEIGSVKGTVAQIGEYDFSFDFEGKRRKLGKGDVLEQAKVVGDIPQVAAPAVAVGTTVSGP
jgi:hypothetical protein